LAIERTTAVYCILHIPRTAGQTIEYHLAEHCPPGALWSPRRVPYPLSLFGRRYRHAELGDTGRVRALAGHDLCSSLERRFPEREIRRIVLLREPLSLQLSLYNYRMMNHLAKGLGTYSFAVHLGAQPRDFIAHWLLARWLEIPWPRLMMMSDDDKYRLLNRALGQFWFVGDYADCDRVIAAIAPDLEVPAIARPRNTARQWHKQIKWQPLTEANLSPQLRDAVRRQNPLDRALWETWRGAGFAAAAVRPEPLQAASPGSFLAHEAARPFFLATRWARREGAPRLPFTRAKSGLRSGIARADRARDAGQYQLAARHYRQALSEEPELPAIWVQYGNMLGAQGEMAAAEAAYRESLRLDPENADAHLQLGHALKLQGQIEAAESTYLSALALDPRLDFAIEALEALGWTRARIDEALRRKPEPGVERDDLASESLSGNRGLG
jgi:tetratricopeptide (TPR) repeat protein